MEHHLFSTAPHGIVKPKVEPSSQEPIVCGLDLPAPCHLSRRLTENPALNGRSLIWEDSSERYNLFFDAGGKNRFLVRLTGEGHCRLGAVPA